MAESAKIHIPLGKGLACGTRSWAAHVNTNNRLCSRCERAMETFLRECIREHVAAGATVTGAEELIDRFLGVKAAAEAPHA